MMEVVLRGGGLGGGLKKRVRTRSQEHGLWQRQLCRQSEETPPRTSSMSRPTRRPSGLQVRQRTSSQTPLPRSEASECSEVTKAASEAAENAADAAGRAQRAAEAANRAAESAERASRIIHRAVVASKGTTQPLKVASSSGSSGTPPSNPWNRFQQEHQGRGWGTEKHERRILQSQVRGPVNICLEPGPVSLAIFANSFRQKLARGSRSW